MNIEAKEMENAVVVKVTGRMDAENAPEFERACQTYLDRGKTRLIADLDALEYVSSMGLRSFLSVAQKAQAHSGSLALCGLKGLPRQVFEMTRLIGLFPVFENTGQALARS